MHAGSAYHSPVQAMYVKRATIAMTLLLSNVSQETRPQRGAVVSLTPTPIGTAGQVAIAGGMTNVPA